MFSIIHRKARKYAECRGCSPATAAAAAGLGMSVELPELRQGRRRLPMYSPLPASTVPGVFSRQRLLLLLAQTTALAARCCFVAAAMMVLGWLLFLGSPLHWHIATGDIKIPATAHTLYESKVLGTLTRDLVGLCLAPAAVALAAVALLALQPAVQQQQLGIASNSTLRGWTSRLLPPRALWRWLFGSTSSVTVSDSLLLCLWAAINLSWFTAALAYYQHKAVLKAAANGLAHAATQQVLKAAARSFGATLASNLSLLMYPISRGSAVLQVLGVSYPAGIRFHRWLGHAVLALVALHGLTYHLVWLASGQWVDKALEQGSGHNNLLGSVAFLFGLALWLTSLETVRRANYALFKAMHHIGFWGFMVCGVCHKWDLIWSFLPGLVLYLLDGAYRLHQAVLQPACAGAGGTARVLHGSVSSEGSLCTLVLESPGFAAAASGYLWLCVPALSPWQYHPFEYTSVPWDVGSSGSAATGLLLHIKPYNRWTTQLVALVSAKGEKIAVNLQGPYCDLPNAQPPARLLDRPWTSCSSPDGIIIIAGGNGISSALPVCMELAAAAATPGLPCLLVWASRSAGELETMGPLVLGLCQALQLQLTTKFFFTGALITMCVGTRSPQHDAHPAQQPSLQLTDAHCTISCPSGAASEHTALLGTDACKSTAAAAAVFCPPVANTHDSLAGAGAACDTSSLCPVVALGSWWGQAGHKLGMHLVVFAGALCAVALGQHIQETQAALLGSRWPTAKAGLTYIALLGAFVLGPALVTLWASLLLRQLWRPAKGSSRGSSCGSVRASHEAVKGEAAAAVEAASSHIRGQTAIAAVSAAAVAAVSGCSSSRLLAAADGSLHLQLPTPPKQQAVHAGSPANSTTSQEAVLQPSAAATSSCLPVDTGRPPLQQLVKSWLATQQQLVMHGHSSGVRRYTVYGMGPEQLVCEVQQLCDDVAGLSFVRRTHQL